MFFIAVYIHIFRGLYYGSYKERRVKCSGSSGVVIFLLMMATGFLWATYFLGDRCPSGALQVITNLLLSHSLWSEIPVQ